MIFVSAGKYRPGFGFSLKARSRKFRGTSKRYLNGIEKSRQRIEGSIIIVSDEKTTK